MADFIEVTLILGTKMILNLDGVRAIEKNPDETVQIVHTMHARPLIVRESYDTIKHMMRYANCLIDKDSISGLEK